ncbi:fused MFS/spermidine synthase [Candidatus Omnitrophota bacterium]
MLKLYAMNSKTKLNVGAFVLGLTSMIGQIIIIRELVVVSYGNELSLGIILASWLFWTSLGSALLGRLVDRLKHKEKVLSNIQLGMSLLLPLNIFLIRNIKSILRISTGEITGVMPMISSSFLSLSIICMTLGFTFTLISKLSAEKSKSSPSKEISRVYLLEGLGASIGGVIYSFFLIKTLTPFQNIFIVGSLNLLTSLFFNRNILQLLYLIILSITFIFNWPSYLEQYTRRLQFRPFQLIENIDSIYGNIAVTKIGKEFSFYENGLLLFTSGDLLTSEESVHYAMLEHPRPEKILLIGGGMAGSLNEILKHPVKNIDYVELDPLIIKLAEKYLPPIKDKRVNIINMDGRLFVKSAPYALEGDVGVKGYDVVILNLPDPHTAMLNRFYSAEFFSEVKKILAPGGIFSFSLTSSENYINPEQALYLGSIHNALKKEFQDIKVLPGDTATFLASDKPGILTYDANILIDRLKKRKIHTKFVREYYMPFKLNPQRIKYIQDSIEQSGTTKVNQDFKPVGYLYHLQLWMSRFYGGRGILPYFEKITLKLCISIIIMLFIAVLLIQRLARLSFKIPLMLSIGSTGMSEICFQIIVILAFQFLYGYMYYKIGLILTSFMIGLVLGALSINKILKGIDRDRGRSLYLKTQGLICLYPLILPIIFIYIAKIGPVRPHIANTLQASFAFLPAIAGFIGGFQFPLANKISLKDATDVGRTTGLLYGIDLLGSCIGGLLAGLVLVPILGIIQTCIFLSILNTLVLILLSITPIQSQPL